MRTILLFLALVVFPFAAMATPPSLAASRNSRRFGFSTSGMGVVSFFRTNERHSTQADPTAGFGVNARAEFIFSEQFRVFTGLEFFTQSCNFNTYYFAHGYSTFYNKDYDYLHELRTYEVHLPVLFRVGLTPDEDDADNSFYMLAGWALKWQPFTHGIVTQISTGKEIWNDKVSFEYENRIVSKKIGNILVGGLGFNKRFNHSKGSIFFEAVFRYGLSRFFYAGNYVDNVDGTNDLLIRNNSLSLGVGWRM